MWRRHADKEGCRHEREAEEEKEDSSLTAFCNNYRAPPYYILPTPAPAPDGYPLTHHKLVFFPNLSEICLFKHPLKKG